MTSPRRRVGAAWLVAPVAAGTLAVSADWAVRHDPLAAAPTAQATQSSSTSPLQRRVQLAASRLQSSQTRVVRLESSVHQQASRLTLLHQDLRAIRTARRTGQPVRLPSGGTAAPAPAATLPPPVAVPPPVSTTTGAS